MALPRGFIWRNTGRLVVVHEPKTVRTPSSPTETEKKWYIGKYCCMSGIPLWEDGMGNTSAIDPSSLPAKGENVSVAKADESKMAASAAKQPSETEKSPPNVVEPRMPSGVSAGVASQPGGSGPASPQRKD